MESQSESTSGIIGRCVCGELHYELEADPLFVHACHCLDCQRMAGSAFSITCFVLRDDITQKSGSLTAKNISARSTAHCCAECSSPIFISSSDFPVSVRLYVPSVTDPRNLEIGAHIWVKRKHNWLGLPENVPQFDEQYDQDQTWPHASLQRLKHAESAL